MKPPGRESLVPWERIGWATGAIGLAALAVASFRDDLDRTLFESGAFAVLGSVDRVLPLVGLGLAFALLPIRKAALGGVLFAAGLAAGFVAREPVITAIVRGPGTANGLLLFGPLACVAAGAMLVPPERARDRLLYPFTASLGFLIALVITLADPSFHDPGFSRGATTASIWLVATLGLAAHGLDRRWFGIGLRILGSWLIAIGLMLGGAVLVPHSSFDAGGPPPQLPGPSSPGAEPEIAPPTAPGFDSLRGL